MSDVLVLGATGYVGGRLIPELLAAGHRVRCLARSPHKLDDRPWRDGIDVVAGDLFDPGSLDPAFEGIDVAYYLVHSLGTGDDFAEREQTCAANAAAAAERAGLDQIVYLGGLGDDDDVDLSPHLRSRHEVGRVLAAGSTPVTELRAAVILGSGSASFEMLRGLTEILPAMVTPRWVQRTRCQPIAIRDVLRSLLLVLGRDDATGVWEIGGRDVVSYAEMMQAYARVAGLPRRLILPVPVLTPRLSARWVDLVTDLPAELATELVLSLQNDVVVGQRSLHHLEPLDVLDLETAIGTALASIKDLDVPTRWTDGSSLGNAALPRPWDPEWSGGTVLEDVRHRDIDAPAEVVMAQIRALGGANRWHGYDLLWDIRGWADALLGGPGPRDRRHPTELRIGDIVDSFVVDELAPDLVRLRAQMKLPGWGWLEWSVAELGAGRSRLTQRARFVPRGLIGRGYWLAVVPFHHLVFGRMIDRLATDAETAVATAGARAA